MTRSTRTRSAPRWRRWTAFAFVAMLGPACDDEVDGEEVECIQNNDCEGGAICINGTCATDISCTRNSDCAAGRACINGSCVPQTDGSLDTGERDFASDSDLADALPDVEPDGEIDVPLEDLAGDADVRDDPLLDPSEEDPADEPDADDVAPDPDANPDAVEDLPANDADAAVDVGDLFEDPIVDLVPDPDLFEDFDVSDEDGEIVLNVATFADLPPSAPEGTRAYVSDLDEEFRYSGGLGRWIFDWFHALAPVVDNRIDGDVTPANETTPWAHVIGTAGRIEVEDDTVVLEAFSPGTGSGERAFARYLNVGLFEGANMWFTGEFSLANSTGVGFLRHTVDARNGTYGVFVNLGSGSDGIRIVNDTTADLSLDTIVEPTPQLADEPRLVEAFLFADGRAELYVDHVLIQSVAIGDMQPGGADRGFNVGVQRDTGGGTVTVANALFGRFSVP